MDNIPRVLPKSCDVIIRKGTWEVLPIFQLIQAKGGVPEDELYQVFNMGIGMVAHRGGRQSRGGPEVHPRAKAAGLADRPGGEGQGSSAGGLRRSRAPLCYCFFSGFWAAALVSFSRSSA